MATSADIQTYNSDLDAFELYHKEKERRLFAEPELPALGHGIAGSVGAAVSNAAIYPLNLLITRAQTRQRNAAEGAPQKKKSPIDLAREIYAEDGLEGLYAGLGIDTVKHSLDSFLFFMAYNTLRQSRLQSHGSGRKHLTVIDELGIGFLAGSFSKFFTSPLSNIVTTLQVTGKASGDGKAAKPTVASVAKKIKDEKGLAGFWTGYSAQLILTLNPSLTFFFHEFLNKLVLPKSKREHPPFFATFLLAAISKSFASCVTYPFTLAKARAQTSSKPAPNSDEKQSGSATGQKKKVSIFKAIAQIARQDGLPALYEGLELEVLKGFISHGLTMVIKDLAHAFILKMYWALLRLLKRYPDRDEEVRQGLGRTLTAAQSMRTARTGSIRELSSSLFDEDDHLGHNSHPVRSADDLVTSESEREWSHELADDVFANSSRLRNHRHADQYKRLLVDFIEDNTKGKPRNVFEGEE